MKKSTFFVSLFLLVPLWLCGAKGDLVDLANIDPSIVVDLPYATTCNFTRAVVYQFKNCSVVEKVAQQLALVQKDLKKKKLGLKVLDGFRPMAAQKRFWEICPDPRYVSPPSKGGKHTRGTAVDVTLIDASGKELEMPTPFDEFSEKAGINYTKGISKQAIKNRRLLQRVMKKHGFELEPTEWWHFNLKGWRDYPVIG